MTRTLKLPNHLSLIYGYLGNVNRALESQGFRHLSWVFPESVYRAS
jgi:hypothetical protein